MLVVDALYRSAHGSLRSDSAAPMHGSATFDHLLATRGATLAGAGARTVRYVERACVRQPVQLALAQSRSDAWKLRLGAIGEPGCDTRSMQRVGPGAQTGD